MIRHIMILLASLVLLSCSEDSTRTNIGDDKQTASDSLRKFNATQINRGRQLYLKNCTVCHGINAEGSPDWRKRNADGSYPPPPLNGTGHSWHHPKKVLVDTIKEGTARLGGKMPAWKGKLSNQDIDDIISWFQSQWPDELYKAWYRMDKEAGQKNR